jgi:multidrug efflux pump subunit AcrA (membrane-fusion protein)
MSRLRLLLLALLSVLLPACMDDHDHGAHGHGAAESAQQWTCSMHPQVVQDGPGSCPICGMDLTPMAASGPPSSDVRIDPGIVQNIGVETAPVDRTTVFRHLRTLGEVEVGEDELSVVNLRLSGWAERVRVDKTGAPVNAGQVLFDLYSPELVAAQEEYLLALRSQGADSALAKAARRRLELWNIADRDLRDLTNRGEAARTMPVRAPSSGFVLHKDLVEGGRVMAGRDLYRIGNLQRIWVRAEVYEHDAPWVAAGQPAQLELTHRGGEVLEGRVDYVYPTLDAKSRTLSVRLEFDNPGVQLKPGMFATVHIQFQRKDDVLAVPTAAILHSGSRRVVFVAHGQGRFEPREVTTGLQGDRRTTEITAGLTEGELVVTSGQFLLDAEAQLQEALGKLVTGSRGHAGDHRHEVFSCPMHPAVVQDGPGRCPECGMDLEAREGTEAERAAAAGVDVSTAYTCPMHPAVVQDGPGRCPDCGMFLEPMGGAPAPAAAPQEDAPAGPWHCPDHPGIAADGPGACIVCGKDRVETEGAPR